jgi:hypothetical protein
VTDAPQHPFDEIAVYAVDGLEPDEQAAVEAHVTECPICRAELDDHLATLARLTSNEEPSVAVWLRVRELLAAEAGAMSGAAPASPATWPETAPPPTVAAPPVVPSADRPATKPRHLAARRRRWQPIAALAAAAALVVAALGAGYVVGSRDDEAELADVARSALESPDAAVAPLATPDGTPVARVVVTDGGTGYFFADDLAPLEAGRTYQLWRVDGPQPVSMGLVGDGTTPITAVAVPAGTATMAVSAEAAGGAVLPAADQVIASGSVTS